MQTSYMVGPLLKTSQSPPTTTPTKKTRIYLKSISTSVHVERGPGTKNTPLHLVMSESRKLLQPSESTLTRDRPVAQRQ